MRALPALDVHGALTLVACVGHLALALLTLTRRQGSPLTAPLGLLTVTLFTWNFADLAYDMTNVLGWHVLDVSTSPFTTPLALHFVLVFVGRRRSLRHALFAAYLAFGALSLTFALGFLLPDLVRVRFAEAWHVAHLSLVVPFMGLAVVSILRYLRSELSEDEKFRARTVLVALLMGTALGATDILGVAINQALRLLDPVAVALGWGSTARSVVPDFPALANVGTLVSTALLTVVAVRLNLFERNLSFTSATFALVLSLVVVSGYLALLALAVPASWVFAAVIVMVFVAVLGVWRMVSRAIQARERTERLVVLGRLSDQLAHDLKNPLASMQGAVQFLLQERNEGRSLDPHGPFLELMHDELKRLGRVIDKYRTLSVVERSSEVVSLNEVIARVLALEAYRDRSDVTVDARLSPEAPHVFGDVDLWAMVVENLVQNAVDAIEGKGSVVVSTAVGDTVELVVEDDGRGMDARTTERIFDDFYTTKPHGTGLGLAFVRRVVLAQRGDVRVDSAVGRGTRVTLRLPRVTQ